MSIINRIILDHAPGRWAKVSRGGRGSPGLVIGGVLETSDRMARR